MLKLIIKPAKIISLLILGIFFFNGLITAQDEVGLAFLKNYSVEDYKAHTQNFSIVQDNRGVMYFGNFSGILEFDGTYWRLIPTENRTKVSSLAIDDKGRIYVGTRGEIGYLEADSAGKMRFHSISHLIEDQSSIFLDIQQIYSTGKGVYFIGDDFILLFDNNKFNIWKTDLLIKSAFVLNDELVLDIQTKGLNRIVDNTLTAFKKGKYFPDATEISAMFLTGEDEILIATANQGLFKLKDEEVKPFLTDSDKYFLENQITCGSILTDGTYAFGTYRKGIVIIYRNGKLKQLINKDGKLQNENVKQLYIDREKNLWAALNNGISMIETPSPLSYYDERSGLNGGVTRLLRHNGILYASSYQGLYYYKPNTLSFAQIPGIITSCWSIIPFGNSLLASSSQGVFQITNFTAKQISGNFSLSILQSKNDPSKIYVGHTEGFLYLKFHNGNWKLFKPKYEIEDEVREIIEDNHGFLWLNTSSSGIIKYDLSEKEAPKVFGEESGIPHLIGNNLSYISENIIVTSYETINQFDYKLNKFKPVNLFKNDTSNAKEWIYEIVEDNSGNLWTNSGDEKGICLYMKNDNNFIEYKAPFLSIADFVAWTIYPEDNGLTWFGGPDGLIRYDANLTEDYKQPYLSLVRSTSTTNDSVLFYGAYFNKYNTPDTSQNNFMIPVLSHNYNAISIDFSAVSYNHKEILMYQYYLEGFDKIWSEWTTNNNKEYTNLHKGRYVFKVKSKNIYNTEGSEASYSFVVQAAWYNTVTAYILYILIAAFMVYIIVRLRSRQLIEEKKALESVIQERTAEIVQQKEEIEKKSQDLAFKNDELEKINQVVRSINAEIHFTNLLNTMLEKTRVIKGVEKATALIREKDADKFKFTASFGWDIDKIASVDLTLGEAEERYLKYSDEIFEDIFFKKKFKHQHNNEILDKLEGPKSMIIIVIKVENKVEGFLILENMNKEDAFDEQDFSFLKNSKEHLISAFIKTKILQDLQNTLDNLKDTQTQLVQSEKLASLGQLTAGIAHEIQNPLNFVNNFSSLSIDLADELKEYLEKEKENINKDTMLDIEEVIEMIESNVTKINEHGKRAERIVKGMLQHSRGSSGEFEETEFNNLVSEYVNLAFHGMRAKDKSFNTAINTDLDPDIGKVRIVPQDFSRVILNIINNGCYAVDQKKKKTEGDYSPEVKVSTKKIGDKIEIRIRDNGTGMPQEVIDKIFNPFFTTKPT
ncbi:MAG: hypothetical protein K8S00_05180, partial [Bacteroidales bacterium]|nr:hypothetical protein [Bacteroidales bacterium]